MPEPKSGMGHDFEKQWGIVMAGGEAVQNYSDYQAGHISKDFLWVHCTHLTHIKSPNARFSLKLSEVKMCN